MSTKICPECGGTAIVALRSINKKLCSECLHEYDWNLDEGQVSLLAVRRAASEPVGPTTSPEQRSAIRILELMLESNRRYADYSGNTDLPVAIHPRHAELILELIKLVDMRGV